MNWLQVDGKAKVPMGTSPSEVGQPQAGAAPLPRDHDYRNVFNDMMGARSRRVLPSQHACTAVGQLTSDKTAFNLLVSHCEQNGLGVLTNELPACTRLLDAVCNVLRRTGYGWSESISIMANSTALPRVREHSGAPRQALPEEPARWRRRWSLGECLAVRNRWRHFCERGSMGNLPSRCRRASCGAAA